MNDSSDKQDPVQSQEPGAAADLSEAKAAGGAFGKWLVRGLLVGGLVIAASTAVVAYTNPAMIEPLVNSLDSVLPEENAEIEPKAFGECST